MSDPLTDARAAFADDGIPFPPVPDPLAGRVRRLGPREWGFGGPAATLFDRETFHASVVDDPSAEFLRFGHDGYSMTSEAVCYFAATGSVAILLQVPWGGPDFDLADSAERLRETWSAAGRLLDAAGAPGPRVVVGRSFFDLSSSWGRLPAGGGEPDWHHAPRLALFDAALRDLCPDLDSNQGPTP